MVGRWRLCGQVASATPFLEGRTLAGPDAIIPTGSGDTIELTLCHSRQLLRIAFTGSHAFLVSPQTARVLGAWLQHLADELDPPNEPVILPFPTLEQDEG
jgi:hypothetical protein